MKTIFSFFALACAFALTACNPVEDYTKNTANNYTADQINATLVQEDGDNLVKVTVHNAATAHISNGAQTIKANYADLILRQMGDNTVTVKLLNANGTVVEKQYPVKVTKMTHELPVLEQIIWQGQETGGNWSGTLRFCVPQTQEGVLPYLDADTYDWMVGKKLSIDIAAADPGATLRVTTGWWSMTLYEQDIPIESAPCKIQIEMTQEFANQCKTEHLLFTGNGNYTITKFYYEL